MMLLTLTQAPVTSCSIRVVRRAFVELVGEGDNGGGLGVDGTSLGEVLEQCLNTWRSETVLKRPNANPVAGAMMMRVRTGRRIWSGILCLLWAT